MYDIIGNPDHGDLNHGDIDHCGYGDLHHCDHCDHDDVDHGDPGHLDHDDLDHDSPGDLIHRDLGLCERDNIARKAASFFGCESSDQRTRQFKDCHFSHAMMFSKKRNLKSTLLISMSKINKLCKYRSLIDIDYEIRFIYNTRTCVKIQV